MIAFLTGYFAFLPAAALGASGVLAVVTAGVYMGWHTPELTTVETRLQGRGFWAIFSFLLNALLFGLVGLQLRPILDRLSRPLAGAARRVRGAALGRRRRRRFACGFPVAYVPRWLSRSIRERDPYAAVAVHGVHRLGRHARRESRWPPRSRSRWRPTRASPFPDRDLIVFLAFCVVLSTLVIQGLSLPLVDSRCSKLEDDGLDVKEDAKARIHAADAAIARLEELVDEDRVREDTAERLRGLYEFRRNRFRARLDDGDDGGDRGALAGLPAAAARAARGGTQRRRRAPQRGQDQRGRHAPRPRDLDLEESRLDV